MRRGFTLIELLVVIAIIAILAAILFPVFARAREKARQSSCLSNVKQVMLAIQQYVQDNDQSYPLAVVRARLGWTTPDGTASTADLPWFLGVYPYMKNIQILRCPSSTTGYDGGIEFNDISYGYNEWISMSGGRYGSYEYAYFHRYGPIQEEDLKQPANTMCIAEKSDSTSCIIDCRLYDYGDGRYGVNTDEENGRNNLALDRHNEGLNVGFCDGHAKWMNAGSIPDDEWDGGTVKAHPGTGKYAERFRKPNELAHPFWVPTSEN